MVKRHIISDAKQADGTYSFGPLFAKVAPYLKQADLTIGNLETTFAGNGRDSRKSLRSSGPIFKCPDELAPALKEAGFDVLVTANNHCMDYGTQGLIRTLKVLDHTGIDHTGTSKSLEESKKTLIKNVKGITIGILSYTAGTNRIPVPASQPWLVNRIVTDKIIREIRNLKRKPIWSCFICISETNISTLQTSGKSSWSTSSLKMAQTSSWDLTRMFFNR